MYDALHPTTEDALVAWAARVRGNREQADRFREAPERADFYAPVAAVFKADPHRTNEPVLEALKALVQPGETWLDVGAGGGRYSLALALRAKEVVAVEPSDGMLNVLREGMAEHDIQNIQIIQTRWPTANPPQADVCLISHVSYDIEDIGPFLDALEASARRLCVAVLQSRAPSAAAQPFWPAIHGEERIPLPALPEFLALQLARGRLCGVWLGERPPQSYPSREQIVGFLRQQLFVEPGTTKDAALQKLIEESMSETDGRFSVLKEPTPLGIVTWKPQARS